MDLSAHRTLSEIESITYSGESCLYTVTHTGVVTISGTAFPAYPLTYTMSPPGDSVAITLRYSGVTLSTLSVRDTLTILHPRLKPQLFQL